MNNKTELNERILWHDGDSTVPDKEIVRLLTLGMPVDGLFVSDLSQEITRYNQLVDTESQILVKEGVRGLDLTWNLPEKYRNMGVLEYVLGCYNRLGDTPYRGVDALIRINQEMNRYVHLGLLDVLRALIYIINTLRDRNIVWGVGRGSCVASYVLYLIGVHDVDSIQYDLDITEFLRTE